jgi:hypothetical protein
MPLNLRRLLWSKDVPLVWCIFVPTALTIGLTWLLVYYLSGDRMDIADAEVEIDRGNSRIETLQVAFGAKRNESIN